MVPQIPRIAQKSRIFIHAGSTGINISRRSVGTLRKAAQGQIVMSGHDAAKGQLLELFQRCQIARQIHDQRDPLGDRAVELQAVAGNQGTAALVQPADRIGIVTGRGHQAQITRQRTPFVKQRVCRHTA